MSKRVRGAKADSWRWFAGLNTPNPPQFGQLGDVASPPIPFASVGGIITLSADVTTTDILPSTSYTTSALTFYNPIEDYSGLTSGFLVLGCAFLIGTAYTGIAPPSHASGPNAKFGIAGSTNGTDLTMIFESISFSMTPTARYIITTLTPAFADTPFNATAIGVNSFNSVAGNPYNGIEVSVANQSGATTIAGGTFRLVFWGVEF